MLAKIRPAIIEVCVDSGDRLGGTSNLVFGYLCYIILQIFTLRPLSV